MTLHRLSQQQNKEHAKLAMNDPKRKYYALRDMNGAFLTEHTFVFLRRSLIGAMRDPTAIILAIVTTALEEAIMRSTMVYRDTFFRKSRARGSESKGQTQ